MASGITRWGASYVLNTVFGQRNAPPVEFWVALLTASPGEHADGSLLREPDPAAGYTRARLPNDQLSWGAASGGVIAATAAAFFPPAAADWPIITGYALCDAQVGGNVFLYGDFTVPRKVAAGDVPRIAASTLNLTVGSLTTSLSSAF